MKSTRLFDKKIALFSGECQKVRFERRFYREILTNGFEFSIPGKRTIYTIDLPELIQKCDNWSIQVVGIETDMDGPYSLHIWCIEEYANDTKDNAWMTRCIKDIKSCGVEKDLLVFIDIPDDKISILQNIYNLY